MQNRRSFIRNWSIVSAVSSLPGVLSAGPLSKLSALFKEEDQKKIWGLLLHLSFNMWEEYVSPEVKISKIRGYRPYLNISQKLWDDTLNKMGEEGLNMVVMDMGNAVRYESHPEIAVRGAWSPERLREELDKIRALGIEPIPKMNFSTGHDTWLKEYSRMVSTEEYYGVYRDLIAEVTDLFDHPRFFHLGMDEETANNQRTYDYMVVRQNDLWWWDFYFLISEVENNGARPWIWSDYMWHHPDLFFQKMPKSVLQSNWYYNADFSQEIKQVKAYMELEESGFDQVPTCSNWGGLNYKSPNGQKNTMNTIRFCKEHISDAHFWGLLQTSWLPTLEEYREAIMDSIRQVGEAKRWYERA